MRVFKTRAVAKFCRAEGISDNLLIEAIERAERGLIDADLGGGLIKQRVARPGKGRSGGWRTLIGYRAGMRAVFLFGFAKNARENVSPDQVRQLKAAALEVFELTPKELKNRLDAESLLELQNGKKD